jgi:gamma-glutamyl hydrolase
MSTIRRTKKATNKVKQRPICVGIITIPHLKKVKHGSSHVMKTYVDWFISRDIQVVLIPYDTTEHELYFNMVHGLLIPGGETGFVVKNKTFMNSIIRFIELSLQPHVYFPIWGTCFGFEMLLFVIGGFTKLKRYSADGLYPITITEKGRTSRMFRSFSPSYLHFLENKPSTLQHHDYAISSDDFMNNIHLSRFYTILATSIDNKGQEYVAAIECPYFPIYGVMWHPERQSNAGAFANFFLSELRKNKRKKYPIPSSFLFSPTSEQSHYIPHHCSQYKHLEHYICYFFK